MNGPSAFHLAQRAIWRAKLDAEHEAQMARLEVEIIEMREMRDDPQAKAEAEELIRRVK